MPPFRAVANARAIRSITPVSTVTEIETAIEKLPPEKVEELAAWFDEYRQTISAAAAVFALYDEEEKNARADG